jgi:hypothetical protein
MKGSSVAGFLGAVLLATVVGFPAAQAGTRGQGTSCVLDSHVRFRPGLLQQDERRVSIRFRFQLTDCAGGGVASATGFGGGVGTLSCTTGDAVAKAEVDWNTGARSALNLIVDIGTGSLDGKVVSGRFKGDAMSVSDVSVTPLRGDCVHAPLRRAEIAGSLALTP